MLQPKRVLLLLLAVAAFAEGLVHQLAAPGELLPSIDLPFIFLTAALIFFWYRIDATQRGYKRSALLNIMVIGLTVVALPYYFFRSRGFVGGLRATSLSVLAAIGYWALQYCGAYTAYYAQAI